jgi:hypothetical protein
MGYVIGASVLVVLAVLLARHVSAYDGFRSSFAGEHRELRRRLASARKEVRRLERARAKELKQAKRSADTSLRERESALRNQRDRVLSYRDPGKGKRIARLESVSLHEHALFLGKKSVPVLGLKATVENTGGRTGIANLYLSWPDGDSTYVPFDLDQWKTKGDKKIQILSEPQVRQFATQINNAAVAEERFVRELPDLLAEAEADLREMEEDTTSVDQAIAGLASVEEGSETAEQLDVAKARLADVDSQWASAVGAPTAPVAEKSST